MKRPSSPRRIVVKKPVARRLGLAAQRVEPLLDLLLRGVGRIEAAAFRLGRHAGDERPVVIEPRPRTLVDQEVVQAGAAASAAACGRRRQRVARQLLQQRVVAGPDLAQEQRVDDARGLDQPGQRLAIAVAQLATGRRRCPPARSARSFSSSAARSGTVEVSCTRRLSGEAAGAAAHASATAAIRI